MISTVRSSHARRAGSEAGGAAEFDVTSVSAVMPAQISNPKSLLVSLQVLRGIAASSVVLHHTLRAILATMRSESVQGQLATPSAGVVQLGSVGVDIFFILSGFLMVEITQAKHWVIKPMTFLKGRFVRIWPLYAVLTCVYLSGAVAKSISSGQLSYNLQPFRLAGIFLVPSYDQNNRLQPIIGPGWTLIYEALFYILFAFCLQNRIRLKVPVLAGLIASIFLLGHKSSYRMVRDLFGSDILFEFIFGSVLAYWIGTFGRMNFLLPGIVLCALLAIISGQLMDLPRSIIFGLPALAIFSSLLTLENRVSWAKTLRKVGDSSYSLYLIHMLVVGNFANHLFHGFLKFPTFRSIALWGATTLTVFVAIVAGYACYHFIERPIIDRFSDLFARPAESCSP